MFVKTVFSIFWICYSLEKYSTNVVGERCLSVEGKQHEHKYDLIQCEDNKIIYVEEAWIGTQPNCEQKKIQTNSLLIDKWEINCFNSSYCQVEYSKYTSNRSYRYLNIRFQCKGCIAIQAYSTKRITCPSTSVIKTPNVWIDDEDCPAIFPGSARDFLHLCKNLHTCSVESTHWRTASLYYECEGERTNPDEDISTKLYGDRTNPYDDIKTDMYGNTSKYYIDISTDSSGDVNYVAIAGGILGGVLLIICIIVGVFLLSRRRTSTASGKQIMTDFNPTYDLSHVQTQQETNQQGHLMNSPDTLYVSTLHAINANIVENTTNEVSNTYSHIRNTGDDSDVMYDHTIRHNIHETCDGHYGIAHRRITEDDYDVSGNYRQSLSKEQDPVYN